MERGPYGAAVADYRQAVHDALAPRAGLEAADDSQVEDLLIRSQAVEREAALDLYAGDSDVRELASGWAATTSIGTERRRRGGSISWTASGPRSSPPFR